MSRTPIWGQNCHLLLCSWNFSHTGEQDFLKAGYKHGAKLVVFWTYLFPLKWSAAKNKNKKINK